MRLALFLWKNLFNTLTQGEIESINRTTSSKEISFCNISTKKILIAIGEF